MINGLGAKTRTVFVRKHAPLRRLRPDDFRNAGRSDERRRPSCTNAIRKRVVKDADGSLTLELEDRQQ
ncbi:hypothetical protein ACNKHR_14475 [Shigella flexneri]